MEHFLSVMPVQLWISFGCLILAAGWFIKWELSPPYSDIGGCLHAIVGYGLLALAGYLMIAWIFV